MRKLDKGETYERLVQAVRDGRCSEAFAEEMSILVFYYLYAIKELVIDEKHAKDRALHILVNEAFR